MALTIRPKIPGRISGNFLGQIVQSFSSVKDDNCSLGNFEWLLGLNHYYRSKQNTAKSTSWLFIAHNSRDLTQTTTAAKTSQNKTTKQWFCTRYKSLYISQSTYAKQTSTPRGHYFFKRFFANLAVAIATAKFAKKRLKKIMPPWEGSLVQCLGVGVPLRTWNPSPD